MKNVYPFLIAVLMCVAMSGGFVAAGDDEPNNGPFERIAFRVVADPDRGVSAERLPDKVGKNLSIPFEGRQYKIFNPKTRVLTTFLVEEVREGGVLQFNGDDDFRGDPDEEVIQVPTKYRAGVFLRFLHSKGPRD